MTNGVVRRAATLATSLMPVCCLHSVAPWSIAVVFSSFLLLEGSSLALALSLSLTASRLLPHRTSALMRYTGFLSFLSLKAARILHTGRAARVARIPTLLAQGL